jgi:hypothetical protein
VSVSRTAVEVKVGCGMAVAISTLVEGRQGESVSVSCSPSDDSAYKCGDEEV